MPEQNIAIVTGGSGSIGSKVPKRLVVDGCKQVVQYRCAKDAAETAEHATRHCQCGLVSRRAGWQIGQWTSPAGKRWVRIMSVCLKRSPYPTTILGAAGVITLLNIAVLQSVSAQQTEGERAFRQRCASCHSLEVDGRGAGPSLAGVIGRKAASLEEARYSPALQDSDLIWDTDTLDRFLTDPNRTVPGTNMRIRVNDPIQRQAIIEFLEGA